MSQARLIDGNAAGAEIRAKVAAQVTALKAKGAPVPGLAVVLVGTDPAHIIQTITELHDDPQAYQRMARAVFPYGDGHAAERIVDVLEKELKEGL